MSFHILSNFRGCSETSRLPGWGGRRWPQIESCLPLGVTQMASNRVNRFMNSHYRYIISINSLIKNKLNPFERYLKFCFLLQLLRQLKGNMNYKQDIVCIPETPF